MREKKIAFLERNSWYHRTKIIQEDGSTKYGKKGGFRTEEAAIKSYWEYEAAFQKQKKEWQLIKLKSKEMQFTDYLVYWFEEVYSSRIETTTRSVGAYTLYQLLLPHIGQDIKLRQVNAEYLNNVLAHAALTIPSAGNKVRELLSIALCDAQREGWILRNPMPETKPYPRAKPKILILNKGQIKILLEAASKSSWYLEILLALFCGLRKGEILGLKFHDFDFQKGTVTISRQLVANPKIRKGTFQTEEYSVIERPPKTEQSRRILRVPDVILEEVMTRETLIAEKKRQQEFYEDHNYLCCQENGKPRSLSAFNLALTKLCRNNALPLINVHGLRHMFATLLLEQGVSLEKISGALGHSSIQTTYEYYCDVIEEEEKVIRFVNETFSGVDADEI